jgi:hypothetical protein
MFSKAKKKERIDAEQREQYEYARSRIKQKKNLMRHFVVFLVGSIFLIVIHKVTGFGNDFFIKNWIVWAILIWAFLFFIHLFNVLIMSTFMGKEWENTQLEKLKSKQEQRILELQEKIDKEPPMPDEKKNELNNPPPPAIE